MHSNITNSSTNVAFLIAGVQKGGTTTLDYYLRQHPEICMAEKKEVHFFDNERLFNDNKIPDYKLYHSSFKPVDAQQLLGESTPIYSYWKESPKRIHAYNPEMKFILILRNPIERAYSHWNKETINFHSHADQNKAVETLDFYTAITTEKIRCETAAPLQHRYYSYIDRGFYTEQLNRLYRYFPKNHIHVIKSESLWNSAADTLDEVYVFLGIKSQTLPELPNTRNAGNNYNSSPNIASPVDSPETNPVNIGNYIRSMSAQEKDYLISQYQNEIKALEKMLNWDCSDWLS